MASAAPGDDGLADGEAVDAVHEVVDVGQHDHIHKRDDQRRERGRLRELDAREGQQDGGGQVCDQARQRGQRMEIVDERDTGDQHGADQPANGAG